jgi:hypothetical protein
VIPLNERLLTPPTGIGPGAGPGPVCGTTSPSSAAASAFIMVEVEAAECALFRGPRAAPDPARAAAPHSWLRPWRSISRARSASWGPPGLQTHSTCMARPHCSMNECGWLQQQGRAHKLMSCSRDLTHNTWMDDLYSQSEDQARRLPHHSTHAWRLCRPPTLRSRPSRLPRGEPSQRLQLLQPCVR